MSLALLLAIAGGIYWLIMFSGVYLDNFDVKEAIDIAYNQAGKARSDQELKALIKMRTNQPTLGTHQEPDPYGGVRTVPGLGLTDDDITIERDSVNNTIRIQVNYTREVRLKPTLRVQRVSFRPSRMGPIPP